jgi:glucokinase-like ROK family protein
MEIKSTADQAFVREVNLSLILRSIHNGTSLSRAKLAAFTGLNKSTVSSLVDELLRLQLIHETGMNSAGAGRPATLLEINPQAGYVVGVEFGVDFVSVALANFLGQILWHKSMASDRAGEQDFTIGQTLDLVDEARATAGQNGWPLLGMGLSAPGTVDVQKGLLIFAPNLQWHNVPLQEIFAARSGLKVFVENDANAGTIAEHLFGAARDTRDFIFVFAGVGIGGGLFLNDALYRGRNGYAGELGHSPIMAEPYQLPCRCGNRGCLETYVNQASIVQRVQKRLEAGRGTIIPRLMREQDAPLSFQLIKQAADLGDADAIESLSEVGAAFGQGFASLINIFNPEKIILGGPLSLAGAYLLPAIKRTVIQHSLPEIGQQCQVFLSTFGPDASLIGAIAIVVDYALSYPTHIERR